MTKIKKIHERAYASADKSRDLPHTRGSMSVTSSQESNSDYDTRMRPLPLEVQAGHLVALKSIRDMAAKKRYTS